MTAPVLSPAEQAEVSRFGVHDEEILRDLAEHADDSIRCSVEGAPAVWRIAARCCGSWVFSCQPCRDSLVEDVAVELAKQPWQCIACGHVYPAGDLYADIAREVAL